MRGLRGGACAGVSANPPGAPPLQATAAAASWAAATARRAWPTATPATTVRCTQYSAAGAARRSAALVPHLHRPPPGRCCFTRAPVPGHAAPAAGAGQGARKRPRTDERPGGLRPLPQNVAPMACSAAAGLGTAHHLGSWPGTGNGSNGGRAGGARCAALGGAAGRCRMPLKAEALWCCWPLPPLAPPNPSSPAACRERQWDQPRGLQLWQRQRQQQQRWVAGSRVCLPALATCVAAAGKEPQP